MTALKTIIVDEGVSKEICSQLISFLNTQGEQDLASYFIATQHPGMPDGQIMHHLLNRKTIFLTADRPFHNTVLAQGLRSYYACEGKFTHKKLHGIAVKADYRVHKNERVLKPSYQLPETDIRPFLMPESDKKLKSLRTKRRRIRNHFGGQDHLEQVMITVSWRSISPSSTLFGIRFRISSNIGIKALDASESYICDKVPPEEKNTVALNYALILSIQLILHHVKTIIYFDSEKISPPLVTIKKTADSPYANLFYELYGQFPDAEFIASSKGKFIERLRDKLQALCKSRSNEITAGNIVQIIDNCKNHRSL